MKKLFIAAAATLLTAAVFAQSVPATTTTTATPTKMTHMKGGKAPGAAAGTHAGPNGGQATHKMADAATRAQKMTDRITKSLSLDAATSQKVLAASTTRCQKIDDIMKTITDNKAKNAAFNANATEYKAALKGILTPAQYAQWEQKKAKGKKSGTEAPEDKDN